MKRFLSLTCAALLLASCGESPISGSSFSNASTSSQASSESAMTSEVSSLPSESSSPIASSSSQEASHYSGAAETKSMADALAALHGSLYADNIACDRDLGLASMRDVGVYQDEYENATLYPVPTTGITTYKAADYGVTPEGASANSRNLNSLLSSLQGVEGIKVVEFEEGAYPFTSTVSASRLQNVYLVGHNTKWILKTWTSYLNASECEDFHVNGFTFDMDPSPTIAGTVASFKKASDGSGDYDVTLKIFDEFDLSSSLYSAWDADSQNNYTCSYMECSLDPLTGEYAPDLSKNLIYNTATSNRDYRGVTDMTIKPSSQEIVVHLSAKFPWWTLRDPSIGSRVSLAFTMYNHFGFCYSNCEDVYMEHVTTHVAAGMGLRINGGKNVYLNHVRFAQDPDSTRIMTCTADIVHSITLQGNLRITNCLFASSHDDGLNIKSFYGSVSSVSKSERQIVISQTQNEVPLPFDVGDRIEILDSSNQGVVSSYAVQAVSKIGTTYTVTVDRRPSDVQEDFLVLNDNKATHLYLHNSIIRNKRNRGILLQTRYSEISNCTFHNVIMGAIQALSVGDSFGEAMLPAHCVLKNNKFTSCRGGDIAIFAYGTTGECVAGSIHDMDVENNYLYGGDSQAFRLQAVSDSEVCHNLMHYSSLSSRALITLDHVQDSRFDDNVAYADEGYSSVTLIREITGCSGNSMSNNALLGGK